MPKPFYKTQKMYDFEFETRLIESIESLRLYARRFTADCDEVDDLTQDTFLKALLHKNSFRKNDNFEGWLAVIMRNTYMNHVKRKDVGFEQYDICKNFGIVDPSFGYIELKRVVDSLPPELCLAFNMYVDGCKYREIAEELELPLGTVKSRIHLARKHLKQLLKDK